MNKHTGQPGDFEPRKKKARQPRLVSTTRAMRQDYTVYHFCERPAIRSYRVLPENVTFEQLCTLRNECREENKVKAFAHALELKAEFFYPYPSGEENMVINGELCTVVTTEFDFLTTAPRSAFDPDIAIDPDKDDD